MVKYTLEKAEINDRQALFNFLNVCLSLKLEKETMTISDQLRKEGYEQAITIAEQLSQEDIQQGIQYEKLLLQRLIIKRFGSLSSAYEEMIEQASSDTLMIWSEKLLDVKTLEGVFSND
jgi:hypothetical protein